MRDNYESTYKAAVHIVTHGCDHINLLLGFENKDDFVDKICEHLEHLYAICDIWVTLPKSQEHMEEELIAYVYETADALDERDNGEYDE